MASGGQDRNGYNLCGRCLKHHAAGQASEKLRLYVLSAVRQGRLGTAADSITVQSVHVFRPVLVCRELYTQVSLKRRDLFSFRLKYVHMKIEV